MKLTTLAARHILRRAARRPHVPLETIADRVWEIAPADHVVTLPTYALPNQLERITGSAYTDDPRREVTGGIVIPQAAVKGFLVKDACLLDGAIYKNSSSYWLHPRTQRRPRFRLDREIDRAALYSTFEGMSFFGLWLTDDCAAYALAASEGTPVTTAQPASPHILQYEDWLDMKPLRLPNAFMRELIFFQDFCQTRHKRARFRALTRKLLSRVNVESHPGVFILRGSTGKRRVMHNEREIAERMRAKRGFRVVDITTMDVPQIAAACAGARVVMGVEGSHLIHGLMVLEPGGAVLTLQPPDRFCAVIKRTTDPDQQHFAFVVGHAEDGPAGQGRGFRVDADEVERTLDLLPAAVPGVLSVG